MAEFCLDCFCKMNNNFQNTKLCVISKNLCLCESCAKQKHIVVYLRKYLWYISIANFIFKLVLVLVIPLKKLIAYKKKKISKRDVISFTDFFNIELIDIVYYILLHSKIFYKILVYTLKLYLKLFYLRIGSL